MEPFTACVRRRVRSVSLGGTAVTYTEPRRTGSLIHTCLLPGCGCQPPPPPLNVVAVQCSGTRPPSHCKPRQVRRPPPQWWPACATASAPYARRRCRSRRLPFSSSLGAPCPLAAKLSSSSSRSQHPLLLLNLAAAPPPLPPPQTVEHGGARAAAAGNCAASGRQPDYQLLIRPRQLGDGAALLARWTARATAVQHVLRAAASPCTVCQAIEPLHNDPPIARSNGTKGVGLAMSFARELLASGRVQRVGFIPCAFGGAPLSRWVKQPATAGDAFTGRAAEIAANPGAAGDLYDRAARRLRLGLQLAGAEAAGAEVVFAGVLWHQGESDTHELALAESVQARLVTVIDALRAEAPAGCTVDPSPHSTQPPCAHHGSVRAPWPDRTVVAPPDALAEHRCHSSSANSVPPPRPHPKKMSWHSPWETYKPGRAQRVLLVWRGSSRFTVITCLLIFHASRPFFARPNAGHFLTPEVAQLKALATSGVPFGLHAPTVQAELAAAAAAADTAGLVSAEGLVHGGDSLHFDAPALGPPRPLKLVRAWWPLAQLCWSTTR